MKDSKNKAPAKEFAKEYAKKSDYATGEVGCGSGLAGKICRHNRKKLNRFVEFKRSKMKKSVDFKDTTVSIDAQDQLLAETTVDKKLLDYIHNTMEVNKSKDENTPAKIPFPTGILTLSKREAGLYNGFFQDKDGQIVEKFDSQTAAIIAKTLQLKSLVPESGDTGYTPVQNASDIALAQAHDRIDLVHSRIDSLQKQVISQFKGMRIKYGDFELEIKKSVRDFVNDFKTNKPSDKDVVRKAISSWRKKHSEYLALPNDQAAAKELITNWEAHQDSFCQFVDALSRGTDDEQS